MRKEEHWARELAGNWLLITAWLKNDPINSAFAEAERSKLESEGVECRILRRRSTDGIRLCLLRKIKEEDILSYSGEYPGLWAQHLRACSKSNLKLIRPQRKGEGQRARD